MVLSGPLSRLGERQGEGDKVALPILFLKVH